MSQLQDDSARFIEIIKDTYGYDFSGYDREFLIRRLSEFCKENGFRSPLEAGRRVVESRDLLIQLIHAIMIPVTELFRNPAVFLALREKVIPYLKSFNHFKVWHAGCSTGEEVYSFAIMLADSGLLDAVLMYATDIDRVVLEKAKNGIFDTNIIRRDSKKYMKSGGECSLSTYFTSRYEYSAIDESISSRILFSEHNLATDGIFGEMNLIICRNVLIYMTRDLQTRVLQMFRDSLAHDGFLCLGRSESIFASEIADDFIEIDGMMRIYQKKESISR